MVLECKERNTSVINERVIVQGLLPAEHGARTVRVEKNDKKVFCPETPAIWLRIHEQLQEFSQKQYKTVS